MVDFLSDRDETDEYKTFTYVERKSKEQIGTGGRDNVHRGTEKRRADELPCCAEG